MQVGPSLDAPAGSPLRRLAQSAGSLTVLNLLSMAFTLLIGVLLARRLGPSAYGVYGLAMTVTAIAGMITEFGLPTLTMREVATARVHNKWEVARGLEVWADRAVIALSVLILGGFFLFVWLSETASTSTFVATMVWAILLIPAVALGKLRGLALLSLGHTFAGQFPVLLLRPALFATALALAWWFDIAMSAPLAMAMQVAAALAALVLVRLAWLRLRPQAMREAVPQFTPRIWATACLPMGATEGLRLLQGQNAVLILGLLATTYDVGIYRVADAVSAVVAVGQSILATAATPMFASLHASGDREGLQKVLGVTALGMLVSTLVLGLPLLFAGNWMLTGVFGMDYAPSLVPFLVIWSGSLIFAGFGAGQTYANMTGSQNLVTMSFAISVIVGLLVMLIAVPFFGPVGASVGVLAANIASPAWLWRKIRQRDGINTSIFARGTLAMLSPSYLSGLMGALVGKSRS